MPTNPPTSTRSSDRRLALQDAAAARLESDLDDYADALGVRIRRMLDGQPVGATPAELELAGVLNDDQLRAAVLGLDIDDLGAITAAELEAAADEWFSRYSGLANEAERLVGQAGAPDASTLLDGQQAAFEATALVNRHEDMLFGTMARASAGRTLEVLHGSITDLSHAELAARIVAAEGASRSAAMTEARTRIAEADRAFVDIAVKVAEGREGGQVFLWAYAGPADGNTRPFCAALVGKVFTSAQVGRLSNGQTATHPRHSCGGFNCRHLWVPVLVSGGLDDLPYTLGTDADITAANASAVRTRKGRRR